MLAPSEQPSNSSLTTTCVADVETSTPETEAGPSADVGGVEQVQQVESVPVETQVSSLASSETVRHDDKVEGQLETECGEATAKSCEEQTPEDGERTEMEGAEANSGQQTSEPQKIDKEIDQLLVSEAKEQKEAELPATESVKVDEADSLEESAKNNGDIGCDSAVEESTDDQTLVDDAPKQESVIQETLLNVVKQDDIVRARFVDFEEERPLEEPSTGGEGDDDDCMLMMGNPELQKIREEQVRKWLIFEQENPTSSVSNGSLTESMEVDSLAGGNGELTILNGMTADAEGQEGNARRVRFLTDQEGNLLISVFMTNALNAGSPLSEEPSILNNGGEEEEATATEEPIVSSPSLVVSPPSLENVIVDQDQEEQLVDSIEPSAPPLDDSEDEEEPPSIVLVEPIEPRTPPQGKPPAPPRDGDDSANESSDETLSVSSCNSMIEILPSSNSNNNNSSSQHIILLDNGENDNVGQDGKEMAEQLAKEEEKVEKEGLVTITAPVTPCFQLGELPATRTEGERIDEENEEPSTQPSSLIIHDMEEHDEGLAKENVETERPASPPGAQKVPNVDENNNVVEDSVLEEEEEHDDDDDDADVAQIVAEMEASQGNNVLQGVPFFKPEIGEQIMPDLRRSTSSSDGEVDEEIQEQNNCQQPAQEQQQQQPKLQQNETNEATFNTLSPNFIHQQQQDDHEAQMVSLCIQEEHISAVALTIAKWESMVSKAQSTENLSVPPPPNNMGGVTTSAPAAHAPVTKSASSPCPKTTSDGIRPHSYSPQKPPPVPAKPVHSLHHQNQQQQQVNRMVVIHGTNSPVSNEPLVKTKAAGWSCWGNKVKDVGSTAASSSAAATLANNHHQDQNGGVCDEIIYAQPNHQAGSTMTSITNPSAILKTYPKPLSKGEIVNWLKEGEIHRAGLLMSHHPSSTSPVLVNWFFGLISRQQAERYLQGQPSGTFLVRISTRIWGYTLSYQAANGRTKHFLISAINPAVPATLAIPTEALPPQSCKQQRMSPFLPQGRYAFIGTNMTPYGTLVSLIRHHSHAPITKLGGEKLLNPCPGGPQVAGLESLFQKSATTSGGPNMPPSSCQVMIHSS